jgi:ribosome biogenesis GTPase / thiamine phosphate phosphatase
LAGKHRKNNVVADLTRAYLDGGFDDDRIDATQERFSDRSKHFQHHKTIKTQQARDEAPTDNLPVGQVIQVHSLFCEVLCDSVVWRCTQRKTSAKIADTQIVVGDYVRFAPAPELNDVKQHEGSVARIEPRRTVLTRADSFKAIEVHPIVANAQQMLIVAALHLPEVKWGLVDRMVIAARTGGLEPIVCLNKIDTAASTQDIADADAVLAHYESIDVRTHKTCAINLIGIEELRAMLKDKTTVLAGHSGVGKSSLVRVVEPTLGNIRIGAISNFHSKGTHTTTSARTYGLSFGGHVIDTPGVKLFGLWDITPEKLPQFFPDIQASTAPPWRISSYERILQSLKESTGK